MGKADITKPLLSSRQHPIYLKSCQLHLPNRSGTWLLPTSISSPPLASSHLLLQKPPVLLSTTVHLFSPSGTSDSYKSQQFPVTRRSQLVQELSVLPQWKARFLSMDCELAWCFVPVNHSPRLPLCSRQLHWIWHANSTLVEDLLNKLLYSFNLNYHLSCSIFVSSLMSLYYVSL